MSTIPELRLYAEGARLLPSGYTVEVTSNGSIVVSNGTLEDSLNLSPSEFYWYARGLKEGLNEGALRDKKRYHRRTND